MNQARRWCFTYHHHGDEDDLSCFDMFVQKLKAHQHYRGSAYQLEVTPSTDRLHLQGYVEFNSAIRLAALKKMSRTAHWEVAKGNRDANVVYCSKDDSAFKIDGKPALRVNDNLQSKGGQGERNDLLECAKKISSGEWGREEVFEERPDLILKFSKGVNELFRFRDQSATNLARPDLRVNVLWGPAGTGKTRYAYRGGDDVFILENSNSNNVWWDGYMGESRLIIDDFYGWIPHNQLLRFLDVYPLRLDVKGGTTYARWTEVFITSNKHPREWYHKFKWEEDGALQRRIHHIFFAETMKWVCEKTSQILDIFFN